MECLSEGSKEQVNLVNVCFCAKSVLCIAYLYKVWPSVIGGQELSNSL